MRIIKAYLENSQVRWILGDDDVKMFALKIVQLPKSKEAVALAENLKELLSQLDDDFPI